MRFINRLMLWWRMLGRLEGTTAVFQLGLLASAVLDTITYTLRPSSAVSPRSYFTGVVRSRRSPDSWLVRGSTDDIYNVTPQREDDVDELICASLAPGDVFIDAGANIGYYSILAARLTAPGGAVIAIEPVPETVEILRANCELNHLSNVTIIAGAVWSHEATISLSFSKGNYGMAMATDEGQGSVSVKATTLDSICGSYGSIKVLKIDAEGAEYQVLCGAAETLGKTRFVVLECSEDRDRILNLLREKGFRIRELAFATYILAERQQERNK